jgi:tRNA A37 threonylcarbamoyladenosine modification protein TsaB
MMKQQADRICPQNIEFTELNIETPHDSLYGCGHGYKLTDKLASSLLTACEDVDPEQILEAKSLLPLANVLFDQKKTLLPEEVELVYLREQSHWKTIKEQKLLKKDR